MVSFEGFFGQLGICRSDHVLEIFKIGNFVISKENSRRKEQETNSESHQSLIRVSEIEVMHLVILSVDAHETQ